MPSQFLCQLGDNETGKVTVLHNSSNLALASSYVIFKIQYLVFVISSASAILPA